jgi:molybdenum cofactor guanylyltransferase
VNRHEVSGQFGAPLSVAGIVPCGGQSRRMGRPKAWLPFGGETMLSRITRLLKQAVEPVVVVAAQAQDVPPLPSDVLLVRDEEEGLGPLAGLAAGLKCLEGRADAAYLSSCDVPLLRPEFVIRLVQLLGEYKICVPRVEGYHHPLAAVYRVEVADAVRRLLAERRLRSTLLFDAVSTRVVEPDELRDVDPTFQSLRNVNTPEDYAAALTRAADG